MKRQKREREREKKKKKKKKKRKKKRHFAMGSPQYGDGAADPNSTPFLTHVRHNLRHSPRRAAPSRLGRSPHPLFAHFTTPIPDTATD